MHVVVLANDVQKAELTGNGVAEGVVWVTGIEELLQYDAEAYMDLEYVNTPERNALLSGLLPRLVIINSVTDTLEETHASFVRINGWGGFLSSSLLEGAGAEMERKQKAEEVLSLLNKKIEWLPDEPGFITARVVSMIINEAFLALGEGVSTVDEINTAMKLGTAYPYGPFEWAEKTGLQNIVTLLQKLSTSQPRYTPAVLMVQETNKAI